MTRRRRLALGASLLVVAAIAARYWPLPVALIDRAAAPSTRVFDRRGELLYEARNDDGLRGDAVDARALPAHVIAATLAAEDHRFRWHPGLDPIAIARAAWANLRGRGEGGSTLTQQVARLLLDREAGAQRARGAAAKIREALLAWRLEGRRSKDEILSLYLTLAPYGNQIAGIRRASLAYFGVEPAQLTAAQAAYLAALPQQPSRFNPRGDAARAVARAHWILRRMARQEALDGAQLQAALAERMTLAPPRAPFLAPHFVQMLLAARREPASRLVTTIDARLQRDIEGIVAAHRPLLDEIGARHASVVVLDNRTGHWLAWEGSGDYSAPDEGAINGPVSPRQPGSTLKPFTYALAFDTGYDPGTVLPDIPTAFPTAEPGVTYRPENYDGRYRGPMRARAALAGSENVPAVALASDVGVPRLQRALGLAGFTTFDRASAHYGLGLTLGNAEVRLDELVAAYAGLARGGVRRATASVIEVDGVRPAAPAAAPRFVSHRAAWWVTDILSDAAARAFIFGRGGALEFPFPVAVKTGTSQAYRDNWVVGYTRDVTVGVWVGNFDRTPLVGSSGVAGAGPIFHAAMLAAVERTGRDIDDQTGILDRPDDVERREICLVSGMTAGASCLRRGLEWTPPGRRDTCTWHVRRGGDVATDWPDEYRRWAAAEGLEAAPILRTASRAASPAGFRIVAPQSDAVYLIDPTLRAEFQTLALSAEGARGRVRWQIDGRDAGVADGAAGVDWPLAPGRHTVVATDEAGRSARATFVVK
jgi:penicillin-binding protein 1C